jgi:ADP-ribose pyrophosphatase
MAEEPIKTLESRVVYTNDPWYQLRKDRIELPDGSLGQYTVIERPGGVWILPLLKDGRIVLIRNYRHTIKGWLWEIPAGGLKDGIPPEEMARRELSEEIGGEAESLTLAARFYTMPGVGDELAHVYLARGVTLGEAHLEPTEIMERHILELDSVQQMIYDGTLMDGPSALAVLLCLPLILNDNPVA